MRSESEKKFVTEKKSFQNFQFNPSSFVASKNSTPETFQRVNDHYQKASLINVYKEINHNHFMLKTF